MSPAANVTRGSEEVGDYRRTSTNCREKNEEIAVIGWSFCRFGLLLAQSMYRVQALVQCLHFVVRLVTYVPHCFCTPNYLYEYFITVFSRLNATAFN